MQVLHEQDVRREVLDGRRIAMIGFGAQGRPQALNARDSGLELVVGLRPGSAARAVAEVDGLRVADVPDAVAQSDVVMLLIPDEEQPAAFEQDIAPHLRDGAYLGFAHGFTIHFGKIRPAVTTNVFLVAPKGVGRMVRRQYEVGQGVPCLYAVQQDPAGDTCDVALAYACGIGGGRAGLLPTTFREETETDLFSEQTILCGGLIELIRAGFETLVDAGYAPEVAYFECLHEVKLIADLVHERGIADMQTAISNTAEYGGVTRGRRVVGAAAREAMRVILSEIQAGKFADEWMAEYAAGSPTLRKAADDVRKHPIEGVGRSMRTMMPWLPEQQRSAGATNGMESGE